MTGSGQLAARSQRIKKLFARGLLCLQRAAAKSDPCFNKRARQPGPDRPLVISGVAVARSAAVMALIAGLARREAAQSVGSQQMLRAHIDDGLLLVFGERADRQLHGKNLVGPKRSVVARAGARVIAHDRLDAETVRGALAATRSQS